MQHPLHIHGKPVHEFFGRRYLRSNELIEIGLVDNRVTLNRLVRAGQFPAPLRLTARLLLWDSTEIAALVERLPTDALPINLQKKKTPLRRGFNEFAEILPDPAEDRNWTPGTKSSVFQGTFTMTNTTPKLVNPVETSGVDPDPFDPEYLRLDQSFLAGAGVKRC